MIFKFCKCSCLLTTKFHGDIYLLRSRVIRLLNRMESWQRFFHNKRKQNIQDEMFYPWPSNNSESKSNFMNSDLDTYYSYKKNIYPISEWGINGFSLWCRKIRLWNYLVLSLNLKITGQKIPNLLVFQFSVIFLISNKYLAHVLEIVKYCWFQRVSC